MLKRIFFNSTVMVSIQNVGQLISTFVSVYYLARYNYFAFIIFSKRQILYLASFVNKHKPLSLAQTPYVLYTLLPAGFFFGKFASVGVKTLLNL